MDLTLMEVGSRLVTVTSRRTSPTVVWQNTARLNVCRSCFHGARELGYSTPQRRVMPNGRQRPRCYLYPTATRHAEWEATSQLLPVPRVEAGL
jgi:hypothetical protein